MPSGHYFSPSPESASEPRTVVLALPDMVLTLTSDRGVFALAGVDSGTKLLLMESPAVPPEGDLVDLGCGYGPIACALARRAPGARVWAVEVNERARALCAANAATNGLDNVVVVAPDAVPDDVRFAGLWSNPPIRIGKPALHALLASWLGRLDEGAEAHLVAPRHLGADSLAAWMVGEGWRVRRRLARQGYRLLDVGR